MDDVSAASVVGVGTTAFGSLPGCSADDLAGWALRGALRDAGLHPSDVDGMVAVRVGSYETVAADCGIQPRWAVQLPAEGRMTWTGDRAGRNGAAHRSMPHRRHWSTAMTGGPAVRRTGREGPVPRRPRRATARRPSWRSATG